MRLLLGLVCFLCVPALAVKEYYSLSRSVRALGMGGAFYAYSDDEAALFYNPAGLSLYSGGAQFMISLGGQIANDSLNAISTVSSAASDTGDLEAMIAKIETLQGKPIYVSGSVMPYFIARGFALGILVAEPKVDVALLGTGLASELDVTAISDSGLLMGFAGSAFTPRLHLGFTAKAIGRAGGSKLLDPADMLQAGDLKLADIGGAGLGVDADVGATYEFVSKGSRSGGVSLAINNLLASQFTIMRQEGAPPALVRTVSLGGYFEWRPKRTKIDYLRFLVDFAEFGLGGETDVNRGARTGPFLKHVNLGAEMPLFGFLSLRAGLHQGNLCGGLGISAYALKLDLATYAEELASGLGRLSNRRWALRLAIGFGAPSTSAQRKRRKGR